MKTAQQLIQESVYFSESENWGDIDKIDPDLIQLLISLREFVDHPMIIHNAFELSGHSSNSQHYQGKACDFHFKGIPYQDAIVKTEKWLMTQTVKMQNGRIISPASFCGFGIYPYWNNPGFHLDCRGARARWGFNKRSEQISYEEARKMAFSIR